MVILNLKYFVSSCLKKKTTRKQFSVSLVAKTKIIVLSCGVGEDS